MLPAELYIASDTLRLGPDCGQLVGEALIYMFSTQERGNTGISSVESSQDFLCASALSKATSQNPLRLQPVPFIYCAAGASLSYGYT